MSLINEALKKAQRQRTEETVDAASPAAAATPRITKRGKATSANTLVLVGSGAVVLVVLSVVATVFWVNRPAPAPAAPTPKVATAVPASEPAPAVVVPPLAAPVTSTAPSSPVVETPPPATPATEVAAAASASGPAAPAGPPPALVAATPASVPVAPAPAPEPPPPQPNERITAFVEAIRVTGIRSSGTDSKVLMNERVYRVNDLVDRSLNLRLTKVAPEGLTFTDGNGVTYVKNF